MFIKVSAYVSSQQVYYGAVTYKRIRVTDAERTEKMQTCLSGVHPVMKAVSVAMRVFAESASSA